MPFSDDSLRLLEQVHPDLRALAIAARDRGPAFEVAEGLRTLARQRELLAKGKSQTLDSRHLYGLAIDIMPAIAGIYTAPDDEQWAALRPIAAAFKSAAAALGLEVEWGGDWKSFRDGWHVQLPKSLYADARAPSLLPPAQPFEAGRFEAAIALVRQSEGGWNPADPSMYGITKGALERWLGRAVTLDELKALTWEAAKQIYRADYWQVLRCDDLAPGLDYALVDWGIHSGPAVAAKAMQRIVGTLQDGIVGPVTLAAVNERDPAELVRALMAGRLTYLQARPDWAAHAAGWTARVQAVEAAALNMASAAIETGNALDLSQFTWWQFAALAAAAWFSTPRGQEAATEEERKNQMSMFAIMLAKILLGSLGGINGSKTTLGLWGIVLGFVIYAAQHFGVVPVEPSAGAQGLIDTVLEWAKTLLIDGGIVLTAAGAGHKMGKVDRASLHHR